MIAFSIKIELCISRYCGTTFPLSFKTNVMNTDPKQVVTRQPEDGDGRELNLTNSDATLVDQTPKQADSPTMSDNATSAASDNLTQSVMNGSEINPEYGDAADPTFETI
jgi:hypothetical protein